MNDVEISWIILIFCNNKTSLADGPSNDTRMEKIDSRPRQKIIWLIFVFGSLISYIKKKGSSFFYHGFDSTARNHFHAKTRKLCLFLKHY